AEVRDPHRAVVALGGEEDQEGVSLVVDRQNVRSPDAVASQLHQEVAGRGEQVRERSGRVGALAPSELREVDEQEAEAALNLEDAPQLLGALPVGSRLRAHPRPRGFSHTSFTAPTFAEAGRAGAAGGSAPAGGPEASTTWLRPPRFAS